MSAVAEPIPSLDQVSPANRGLVLRRAHTCIHARGILTGKCQLGIEITSLPIPCLSMVPGKPPAASCPSYQAIGMVQAIRDYTPWVEGGAS